MGARVDWATIGDTCQRKAAELKAELEAAGLGHLGFSVQHEHDGSVAAVNLHDVEEHDEAKAHAWAGRRSHATHVHRWSP